MENRTKLKENRNFLMWGVYIAFHIFITIYLEVNYGEEAGKCGLLGTPLLFLIYRIFIWLFNSTLEILVKKRFTINRLKGRETPIYKIVAQYDDFKIEKWEALTTKLDLEWSIPFSVLFLEQEYVKCEDYFLIPKKELGDSIDIGQYWESNYYIEYAEVLRSKLKKEKEINLLSNLNKKFNDNYK